MGGIFGDSSVYYSEPTGPYSYRFVKAYSADDRLDERVDVVKIFSTSQTFAALRADGSVVSWESIIDGAGQLQSGVVTLADPYTDENYYADAPAYTLAASAVSADEGQTATFALTTANVAAGTSLGYTLSGIQAADVQGGSLSGTAVIGADGKATIPVTLLADKTTEGAETLTVQLGAGLASASILVNDASVAATGASGGANLFLTANASFPIADGAVAKIYGAGGIETIRLDGVPSVVSDQNVERVEFPGSLDAYSFQMQGNRTIVRQAGQTVASIGVQDDADGTRLAFADGSASLKIVGLNAFALGGKPIGVETAAFAPADLGQNFDALDRSATAGAASQTLTIDASKTGGTADLSSGAIGANFAPGDYVYTLSNFAAGDRLLFPAGYSLSVDNASPADGMIDISAAEQGHLALAHLVGLAFSADSNIF
jgi:hypothetical protein